MGNDYKHTMNLPKTDFPMRAGLPKSEPIRLKKWEEKMRISYNPLWKMLIDKNMNKRDLAEKCKISTASVAKLSKGANITTDVLLKICEAMNCHIEDILETVDE